MWCTVCLCVLLDVHSFRFLKFLLVCWIPFLFLRSWCVVFSTYLSFSIYLSCLSICLSVFQSVNLSICLCVCVCVCLSIFLSVCLSISIYLSVCLSFTLSISLSFSHSPGVCHADVSLFFFVCRCIPVLFLFLFVSGSLFVCLFFFVFSIFFVF